MDNQIIKSQFLSFVERNKAKEGGIHTHVSMGDFCRRINVPRDSISAFWDVYKQYVNSGGLAYIAETPQQYAPVLVDVDLKFAEDYKFEGLSLSEETIYTENHVRELVALYQGLLFDLVDGIDNEDKLTCIVLEKPAYNVSGYIKNGFHLHFPWIFLNVEGQTVQLIPRIEAYLKDTNIFADLGIEDSSTVVDFGALKNSWLLYGSSKNANTGVYKATYAITYSGDKISIEEALQEYKIYNSDEEEIDITKRIQEYLPEILSIVPFNRETYEFNPRLRSTLLEKICPIQETSLKNFAKQTVEQDLEVARRVLPLISERRAHDYNSWIEIGWALFNIGEGCREAYELWVDFSRRCPEKFDENTCLFQWDKMQKRGLTLGTLKYFAQKDNPQDYAEFRLENSKKFAVSLSVTNYSVAKFLYEEYGHEFVCTSINAHKKSWYQFKNHIWNVSEDGIGLRSKISNELADVYKQYRSFLLEEFSQNVEDYEAEYGALSPEPGSLQEKKARAEAVTYRNKLEKTKDSQLKTIATILVKLETNSFKNAVMAECAEVFYNERFLKELNSDPYLVAFNNGVYDLKKFELRDGRPSDNLSVKMDIDYKVFTEDCHEIVELREYFGKVFPDTSIRKYFLDVYSEVFIGGNPRKLAPVWTGEGDNSKSIIESMFEKMLSRLCIKVPTSLLTGKRTQSSGVSPEIVRMGNGTRLIILQEPGKNEVINNGILKEISGNDTVPGRDLYQKSNEITDVKPMFMIAIICNHPPKISYCDKAVWNRLRVIPFEATFCIDAPETPEQQLLEKRFPIDIHFANKIPGLIEGLAWLLIEHYKNRTSDQIEEPEKVKMATIQYKRENDVFSQFEGEFVTDDEKDEISLAELYTLFKEWFKEGNPNSKIPTRGEVKEYFSKAWGEPAGRRTIWTGKSLNNEEEEKYDNDNLPTTRISGQRSTLTGRSSLPI